MKNNNIPQSLIIAEARAKVETVLNAPEIEPTVKELIFKEAWLVSSMQAQQQVQTDYESYVKATAEKKEETQEAE